MYMYLWFLTLLVRLAKNYIWIEDYVNFKIPFCDLQQYIIRVFVLFKNKGCTLFDLLYLLLKGIIVNLCMAAATEICFLLNIVARMVTLVVGEFCNCY